MHVCVGVRARVYAWSLYVYVNVCLESEWVCVCEYVRYCECVCVSVCECVPECVKSERERD